MQAAIPFPNIGPDIFSVSIGGFELALRWYAMAYIVGILIGWRIAVAAVKRAVLWVNDKSPMTVQQIEDLLTWVIIGVIAGGRLGYVLGYVMTRNPEQVWNDPLMIFRVWDGGMSFHGGFLGVCLAVFVYTRKHGLSLWSSADMLAISVAPALLLGRLANFINAELWGHPTDKPWGVIFPGDAAQFCPTVVGDCARHPSQIYEALLEGLILGAIILFLAFKRGQLKFPARLTGVFFAGYGLARMFVELFRQADPQFISATNPLGYVIQLGEFGLSMGQLLSLPMVVIGLLMIVLSKRAA